MGCAQGFIYCINVVLFLLGGFLTGISSYVAATFSSGGYGAFVSLNAIYVGIAAGVIMMLVSFLGCAAASKNQNKALVLCYTILVGGILALQIAAAVVIMQYSGVISEQNGLVSSEMISSGTIELNNAILSSYTACCSGCPVSANCNNAQPFFANITAPNCENQNLTCAIVQSCNPPAVNDTCYVFSNNAVIKTPPVTIDVSVCTVLGGLNQNGSALVGPAATGACGRGDPAAYTTNMANYFSERVYWVAVAFAVVAAIQGLIVLSALYILCCVTNKQ